MAEAECAFRATHRSNNPTRFGMIEFKATISDNAFHEFDYLPARSVLASPSALFRGNSRTK